MRIRKHKRTRDCHLGTGAVPQRIGPEGLFMDSGKWNLPARSPSPRSPHGPNPTVPMVNRRGGWPPRPPVLTSPCTYRKGRGSWRERFSIQNHVLDGKSGALLPHTFFLPHVPRLSQPSPSFSVARFTYFTFLVPAHPCSRPPEVASRWKLPARSGTRDPRKGNCETSQGGT